MNVANNIFPQSLCSFFAMEIIHVLSEASSNSFTLFLNSQQRDILKSACMKVKKKHSTNIIDPQTLVQELMERNVYLSLEIIWTIHCLQILPLEIYLTNLSSEALSEFTRSAQELFFLDTNQDACSEFVQIGMLSYFIRHAVDISGVIKEISTCILRDYLEDVFSMLTEDQINERTKALHGLYYCGTLEKNVLNTFSIDVLTYFTKTSSESILEAFAIQKNCFTNKTPFHACPVLKKIMQNLNLSHLEQMLFEVLIPEATNWKNMSALMHAFIQTYDEASHVISRRIGDQLKKSLQGQNRKCFQAAILIGRQSLLASTAATSFPAAYKQWLMTQFGDCQLLKNDEIFTFFIQRLAELIPYEKNANILRASLEWTVFVPVECQPVYMDYKTLLKTRINDLEPRVQPKDVITKLLLAYEESGKIPSYVLEASLVKKHYFLNEFLPVLLSPRVLPPFPDLQCKFIEELDKAGKIPNQMLQKYNVLCRQMKQDSEQGSLNENAFNTF